MNIPTVDLTRKPSLDAAPTTLAQRARQIQTRAQQVLMIADRGTAGLSAISAPIVD